MKYKHIIFDIDGTMLNTETADMLATQETVFQLTGEKKDINDIIFLFSGTLSPVTGYDMALKVFSKIEWSLNI